jgi:hypothetical protein
LREWREVDRAAMYKNIHSGCSSLHRRNRHPLREPGKQHK